MFYGLTKLEIHLRRREKKKMLLDIKHKNVLTLKAENVMYFMSKISNGKSMFIAALQQLSIFSAHSSYFIHLNSSDKGPRHTLSHTQSHNLWATNLWTNLKILSKVLKDIGKGESGSIQM